MTGRGWVTTSGGLATYDHRHDSPGDGSMNKLSIAPVSVLVAAFVVAPWLAACKDKKSSPDCASALWHAIQVSRVEMTAIDDATVARIKQASLTRCLVWENLLAGG